MTEDLEKKLVDRFPIQFADFGKSPSESCMAWGCAVGDGWFPLLWTLCGSIESYTKFYAINNTKIPLRQYLSRSFIRGPKSFLRSIMLWRSTNKRRTGKFLDPVVFDQVKEKYGTLTVYYHGGDGYIRALVDMVASFSSVTCEFCGTTKDTVLTSGWISVRCPACLAEEGKDLAACKKACG